VSAAAAARPDSADTHRYRMKDLCELTGLERQAIHFYIAQGLVPPGTKTGRNMAFYGDEHVERIKLVRRLQHERFLPLRAIRALLHQQEDAFSPVQRRQLAKVREQLGPALAGRAPERAVDATALCARAGVDRADLDALAEIGALEVREDEPGKPLVAESDAWMLELWGELRAAGLTRARGFEPRDLVPIQQAVTAVFDEETRLLTSRLIGQPPAEVAALVERVLPLATTFLTRFQED
jgi:DNA-binding transcriptional MerR regulator